MTKLPLFLAAAATALATVVVAAPAHAEGFRAFGKGGTVGAIQNDRGGKRFAARGVRETESGGLQAGWGRAAQGQYGRQAARGGSVERDTDGTITGQRGFGLAGDQGSLSSTGGFSRSAEGDVSGDRTGTLTSAETGNSVVQTTSFDSATQTGSRSTICLDASGVEISCSN